MSQQIDTALVKQYGANVEMLLQQKGSRLRSAVRNEVQKSEEAYYEQIGVVAASEVQTRHGDSPLNETPHDRRMVTMKWYDWGDLIDDWDKVRALISPESPYAQNAAYALGRKQDEVILDSMYGTAKTGKSGGTSTVFDASNQVVAINYGGTNVGLTIPKLIEAQRILRKNEALSDGDQAYIAINAKAMADLLNSTQATNADYNSVRALVRGEIDSFVGFKFVHTELIPLDGNSYLRLPCWVKTGLLFTSGLEVQTRVSERADKRFSTYVYARAGFGAVRMQEKKIVEIKALAT